MNTPLAFPKDKVPPTVWSFIEAEAVKREARGERVIQLHIGDAYLPFPAELTTPVEDEARRFGSNLNRYSDTFGEPALRELILDKVSKRNHIPAEGIDAVQITAGATGALHAAFAKLLEPGDEVLTLAPYWSILRNVADTAAVKLAEAPFYDHVTGRGDFVAAEALQRFVTSKTRALYINTPSNPTGMVLDRDMLLQIAEFAEKYDLWVFSDEAYEDFIWDDSEHLSIAALPGMWERTVSIFTFSKCFGSSGIRVGCAVAPPPALSQLNRGVVGAYYQPPRLGQLYAWRGMMRFQDALSGFRRDYAPTWEWIRENLKADALPCASTFYYFVRLGEGWNDLSPERKIARMVKGGVVLAPGEYFGRDYGGWARLCFTAVPPDDVKEGVRRLNEMIG